MVRFTKRLGSLLCALCMAVTLMVLPTSAAGSNAVVTIGDYSVEGAEFAYYIHGAITTLNLDDTTVTEADQSRILSNATEAAVYTATFYRFAAEAGISEKDAAAELEKEHSNAVNQYGSEEAFEESLNKDCLTVSVYDKLFIAYNYYQDQLLTVYDYEECSNRFIEIYQELNEQITYGAAYEQIDVTVGYPYGLSLSGGTVDWEGGLQAVGWGATLTVVLVGLLVVFSALVLLVLSVTAFGKIGEAVQNRAARRRQKKAASAESTAAMPAPAENQPAAVKEPAPSGIPGEVVAAIMAAISCMTAGTGKSYTIKRIRRTTDARSVWSAAGVSENTRPF